MRYEIRLAKCRVMVCGSANCHGTSVCRAEPDSNLTWLQSSSDIAAPESDCRQTSKRCICRLSFVL
ncbi:hypothetical protein T4E_354 [Trichinella pseudospiralis]|uniref:Uncharacterized protein n=1 Tax=Trichinella pseudospiralis TaxID=6337 RepID=A0A0V0YLJ3_TRIPS|nr:hypothetical protein T4E_354 [Trichinella pseudospiralis]